MPKSINKGARLRFFPKWAKCDPLAPAQSKRCFWHVFGCGFDHNAHQETLSNRCTNYLSKIRHLLCPLVLFWAPRVLPKRPLGDHFASMFGTFCTILPPSSALFAWLGRMISQVWFRRPVLTENRPSLSKNSTQNLPRTVQKRKHIKKNCASRPNAATVLQSPNWGWLRYVNFFFLGSTLLYDD